MKRNRDGIDIVADILRACKECPGIIQTHLMQRVNLNMRYWDKFIHALLRGELICAVQLNDPTYMPGTGYVTTEKGSEVLDKIDTVVAMVEKPV